MMNNTTLSNQSSSPSTDGELVGWVLESPGRGTLSLVTTCLFTTFLCTWAVIHPRVTRNPPRRMYHKIALFLKTIIAPEFIAVESLQEWSQARNTVKRCKDVTDGGMDLIPAFYIGMLALRYRTERGERIIWPNQYQWLLEQHLINWQDHQSLALSKENIRDKSNANTTVKVFALLQVSWFVSQSIMRSSHSLPLAQLESMTLSYVPLFFVTYLFWWSKPKDVLTPSVINLPDMSLEQKVTFENMSIDTTFDDEHTEEQDSWWNAWKLTPRVFEKEARDKELEEKAQRLASVEAGHSESNKTQKAVLKTQEKIESMVNDSIKRSETEKLPIKRTVTEISRSQRRAFTEKLYTLNEGHQNTDVSSIKPTFVENAVRRATTGFSSNLKYRLTEISQKTERLLPSEPPVLGYWDPELYHSKIWPLACLFGVSFGALHLISWNTVFPTLTELWLWRGAAITSIVSMLIFIQYEKVVLRWGGPLTLLSIVSPAVYLISRLIMIGGVIASFRGMDSRIYETYVVSTYWAHLV
jgi:hypothetical protein